MLNVHQNAGYHIFLCKHCIIQYFPEFCSQVYYSVGIRTHDLCNSRAVPCALVMSREAEITFMRIFVIFPLPNSCLSIGEGVV